MFFHFFFFLSKWNTGQKYNISQSWRYCTCLDIWKKVNYFGYCYLFLFLHGPFIGIQFQMDRLFFLVLCSNVVWNPFLMKTTFTSDFSWFESVFVKIFENTSLLYQYSHLQETHRIMFSFFFLLQHVQFRPHSPFSGHIFSEMNIFTEGDSTWMLITTPRITSG